MFGVWSTARLTVCVQVCPVAVHVCVVHVGQVFLTQRWTDVIGHTSGWDGGHERGGQGRRDGGGGNGGVVWCWQVFHVKAVGAVVQLWQVHRVQAETNRPSQELLSVHHVYGTKKEKGGISRCNMMQKSEQTIMYHVSTLCGLDKTKQKSKSHWWEEKKRKKKKVKQKWVEICTFILQAHT